LSIANHKITHYFRRIVFIGKRLTANLNWCLSKQ